MNEEIVQAGFAWVYGTYCRKPVCSEWNRLEHEARAAGLGLWKDKDPVPPWEWRKERRERNGVIDGNRPRGSWIRDGKEY